MVAVNTSLSLLLSYLVSFRLFSFGSYVPRKTVNVVEFLKNRLIVDVYHFY